MNFLVYFLKIGYIVGMYFGGILTVADANVAECVLMVDYERV